MNFPAAVGGQRPREDVARAHSEPARRERLSRERLLLRRNLLLRVDDGEDEEEGRRRGGEGRLRPGRILRVLISLLLMKSCTFWIKVHGRNKS